MLGHGLVKASRPRPEVSGLPDSSTRAADTPGSGRPADPGLAGVRPGSVVIMMAPVSVCHQVSTTGQRSPPMTVWYHSHAFGLIGSPTDPSSRSDDRSCRAG